MERNLNRRVEMLCPVFDPELRNYLRRELLQAYLRDDARARVLKADGGYERCFIRVNFCLHVGNKCSDKTVRTG